MPRPGPDEIQKRPYDVAVVHQSDHLDWLRCLARNLTAQGHHSLIAGYDATPIPPAADATTRAPTDYQPPSDDGLGAIIFLVTPDAVESGWAREQYQALDVRRRHEPDFRVVPLLLGAVAEPPFLDGDGFDFRDPDPDAYRAAFSELARHLGDRTTVDEIGIPEPIRPPRPVPEDDDESSEARLLDEIFATLARQPIVLLLGQADRAQPEVVDAIKTRAAVKYGEASTLHVTPPWSRDADLQRYFAHIGRQCGFEPIHGVYDWEEALDDRLSGGRRLFLLVSGFENGADDGRRAMAGMLRALSERHGAAFAVVLTGGEGLAELKYAAGELSLLNVAEVVRWPELTVADVLAWQRRIGPERPLDRTDAGRLLEIGGRHPRLVRFALDRCCRLGKSIDDLDGALCRYDFLRQLFARHGAEPEARKKIRTWLEQDDLGAAVVWPADAVLRRLYWGNLLVEENGRLRWRGETLRAAGRQVLECAD